MTPQEAADRAAAVLEQAEKSTPERAQALTWVADSWTRLAEVLAQNPFAVSTKKEDASA